MNIGPRFAALYRRVEYAAFGRALERRRFAFLDRLRDCREVLVPGEGDGRAMKRMLAAAPGAHFEVVEASAGMIELARKRVENSGRVSFRQADARSIQLPGTRYDAIVTLFFLDCFTEEEARALIGNLKDSLAPGGIWLVSEFAIPGEGWRRWHALVWIGVMYRFFALASGLKVRKLPPYERLLSEAGLRLTEKQTSFAGMIVSEVWRLAGESDDHLRRDANFSRNF